MKKKMIFSFICISFVLVLLTGCGYSKEEKQYMKKLESQAKENAINYIKNKYGFIPNVISTDVEKEDTGPVPDFTPDPTGNIYVYLSYKDKKFEVYISGEEQSIDGIDNYQYDEITSATIKYISEKTNLNSYSNSINYGNQYSDKNHNGLIKDLFTNDNLEQIIENNHFKILLEYIGASNLEYIKTNQIFDNLQKTRIILVNYNSLESYNKASTHSYNIRGTLDEGYLRNNLMNIESAYIIETGKTYYYDLDAQQFDDIYYYDRDIEQNFNNNVSLSYTTIGDVSNWVGRGAFKNVRQISDAYLVNGIGQDYKYILIYIPLEKFKNFNVENMDVGVEHCGNYSTRNVSIIGDYLVSSVNFNKCDYLSDAKFTLLYSTYEK